MTIKEFFFLILCVIVSLSAGYGIVKVLDKPLFSENTAVDGVFADTEFGEFQKAVKSYGEDKDLSEEEAFIHLKAKAKEYLQAKEKGRPISEDDESIQRLKTKAQEYLSDKEEGRLRTMSDEKSMELLKSKATTLF